MQSISDDDDLRKRLLDMKSHAYKPQAQGNLDKAVADTATTVLAV